MPKRQHFYWPSLLTLLAFGLGCSDNSAGSAEKKQTKAVDKGLAQAGHLSIDLPAYRQIVAEARVMRQWMSGQSAPAKALSNRRLRRRILIDGLETRVIRDHVQRVGLKVDEKLVDALLKKALLGVPPNQSVSPDKIATLPRDIDEINRRLTARYGQPAQRVRDVIQDVAKRHSLAEDLVNHAPSNEIRTDWERRNRCVSVKLYRVSRVPSSGEIDRAIREKGDQIEEYYRNNPRLFHRDTRVFVRRLVRSFDPKQPNDRATKRKQMEMWHTQIQSGGDLEKLVREHGPPMDRRAGGRLKIKESDRPDLYALKKGEISAIETIKNRFVFYQVLGHAPGLSRALSDSRVQRECAAGVLRESNDLPTAIQTARDLIARLRSGEAPETFEKFLKQNRIRHKAAKTYCQHQGERVPGIGLAIPLVPEILALNESHRISPAVRVRQDFVVAQYIDGRTPDEAAWNTAKETHTVAWKKRARRNIVSQWLTVNLRNKRRWVDQRRLNDLTVDQLIEP